MKISQYPNADALTGAELLVLNQNGVTLKATTQDLADLANGSSGAVVSVNGQTGVVILDAADVGADPAGTATTEVGSHNADPGAHGGVEAALSAHIGTGGAAHAVANGTDAGFMPATSGVSTEYLGGDGAFHPLPSRNVPVQRTSTSPFVPTVNSAVVLIDATAAFVVNLPAIDASLNGLRLDFKIVVGAAGVTINANAADNIDGAASAPLASLYDSVTLVASYDAGGDSFWSIL